MLVLVLAGWEELVLDEDDDDDGEGCCNGVGSMVRQGTRYVRALATACAALFFLRGQGQMPW